MKFKNIRKQYEVSQMVEAFKTHSEDVGSAPVQIASLTYQINRLSKHMKENPKDQSSLRGLKKMSAQRQKQMLFLMKNDFPKYQQISKELNVSIRKHK